MNTLHNETACFNGNSCYMYTLSFLLRFSGLSIFCLIVKILLKVVGVFVVIIGLTGI